MTDSQDYTISVGWDLSEFNNAAAKVEKRLRDLGRLQNKLVPKGTGTGSPKTGAPVKKEDALNTRRIKSLNTINALEDKILNNLSKENSKRKGLVKQVEKLKTQLRSATTSADFAKLSGQIAQVNRQAQRLIATERQQLRIQNQLTFSNRALSDSVRNLARSYISVFAAIEAGRSVFRTGSDFDSLNASLLAASGSARQAGEDFEFIKETSFELGIELKAVTDGYRQIGAAGRFSSLTTEQTKEAFLAATEASRAFGLSADRAGLVYLAFSQILSKGKVSQEELRRQLGEQLPGAMAIAAKSMNVTTSELEEMIQAGISANDFLPNFSKELRKAVRESGALAASLQTITAAQQRMAATYQLSVVQAFDAGARSGVIAFFEGLSENIEDLTPLITGLGRIVGGVLRVITGALNVLVPILSFVGKVVDVLAIGVQKLVNFLGFDEGGLAWVLDVVSTILTGSFAVALTSTIFSLSLMQKGVGALSKAWLAFNVILKGTRALMTQIAVLSAANPITAAATVIGAGAAIYGVNSLYDKVDSSGGSTTTVNDYSTTTLELGDKTTGEAQDIVDGMFKSKYKAASGSGGF